MSKISIISTISEMMLTVYQTGWLSDRLSDFYPWQELSDCDCDCNLWHMSRIRLSHKKLWLCHTRDCQTKLWLSRVTLQVVTLPVTPESCHNRSRIMSHYAFLTSVTSVTSISDKCDIHSWSCDSPGHTWILSQIMSHYAFLTSVTSVSSIPDKCGIQSW